MKTWWNRFHKRWVVLTGPAGEEIAHARVEGLIEPLVVPSTGPGLR